MQFLRYSTASQIVEIGPFVSATDGSTPQTGLTIANTDLQVNKHSSGSEGNKDSGGATHIAGGRYYMTLDATDTDTPGRLRVSCNMSGCLPVWEDFWVLPQLVFDAYVGVGGGRIPSDLTGVLGTIISESAGGRDAAALTKFLDVASPTLTCADVNQTGDSYSRLGAPAGASIEADIAAIKTDTNTLTGRLTAARAGYLDNLNVGGNVASQADINALNQSASRRIIITTVGQYERPESGSSTYTVEVRTYDGDGAAVNADSTPTLTATGKVSGSLNANLSAATNPSTGLYRWDYTVANNATIEEVRLDVSATISSATFPLSCLTQVADFVSATFTTTDRSNITAIKAKTDNLPAAPAATGDQMDLKPATITSIQSPLATASALSSVATSASNAATSAATAATQSTTAATNTATLLTRITSTLFSGITSAANWLRAIARKANTDTTAVSEINASVGAGTGDFDPSTDSEQAIRDRGDAAWVTGSGGGGGGGSSLGGTLSIAMTCTASSTPIPNALVTVRDSTDSTILGVFRADAGGVVSLDPENGTAYKLHVTAPGVASWTNPIAKTWNADGTDSADGTRISIAAPSSPSYCTCYVTGEETPADGDYTARLLKAPDASGGISLSVEEKRFLVVNGDHLELQLAQGATYIIKSGKYGVQNRLTVPATSTCDVLATLGIT